MVYSNVDTQKLAIVYDNKNKSGIYRWINLNNQNSYIGSSIDLARRFKDYLKISFLET